MRLWCFHERRSAAWALRASSTASAGSVIISTVAESDPRPTIIELLSQPAADRTQTASRERAGPVASVVHGNPVWANPGTIAFLKARGTSQRKLFAVTFDDESGGSWFSLVAAERDAEGSWVAHRVAYARGNIAERSSPWLNLAGQWGKDRFYAGGQIHTAGEVVGKVRLILEDGTELEDDAEGNLALFVANHDAAPATVTIYGTDGRRLASHNA